MVAWEAATCRLDLADFAHSWIKGRMPCVIHTMTLQAMWVPRDEPKGHHVAGASLVVGDFSSSLALSGKGLDGD